MFEQMGCVLGEGFWEYQSLIEEDDKQKEILRKQIKMKKKNKQLKNKMDITVIDENQGNSLEKLIPSVVLNVPQATRNDND